MLKVTLEIKLSRFDFCWLLQCHDSEFSGIEVLGKALDRTAFPCCITTLKDDHDALIIFKNPVLQLNKLYLKRSQVIFILDIAYDFGKLLPLYDLRNTAFVSKQLKGLLKFLNDPFSLFISLNLLL